MEVGTLRTYHKNDEEETEVEKEDMVEGTVKFLNFLTSENFTVIYLKVKERGQTLGYFVKKMQME